MTAVKEKVAISAAASVLGRLGGCAKSERKTLAVRENGKKGGRPKKILGEEVVSILPCAVTLP